MKILAVDSSGIVASAAIMSDEKLICEIVQNHKKTHSQKLMPMIDELLKMAEMDISEIDVFAVSIGPGSFTGLRIGVATVKGLAAAFNKPVVGIRSLDGLAFNIGFTEYLICPIINARNNFVFSGIYQNENGELITVRDIRPINIDELLTEIKKANKKAVFLGDGVNEHKGKITEKLWGNALFAPININEQKASSIAYLAFLKASIGDIMTYSELLPMYFKETQAEREQKI